MKLKNYLVYLALLKVTTANAQSYKDMIEKTEQTLYINKKIQKNFD